MGIRERRTTVFCLSAETGKEIWRRATDSYQDPKSTPTIDGEFVYVLCNEGWLLCVHQKNGKVLWKRHIVDEFQARSPRYGFAGSPVIAGDLIILTANASGMAVNKNTGEKVWGSEKPPKDSYGGSGASTGVDYSTPVIFEQGGIQYAVVASFKGLSAVETNTGKTHWLFDWEKDYETKVAHHITDPIVFDNRVFISANNGCFLFNVGGKDLQIVWTNINVKSESGSPVLVDGYFYVCQYGIVSDYGALRCLDGKTGKIMWEEKFGEKPISITAAGKNLIVLDSKGNLSIAEAMPAGYKEISSCQIPDRNPMDKFWTHPVLCNGKIYCRSFWGDLVCIDVRK